IERAITDLVNRARMSRNAKRNIGYKRIERSSEHWEPSFHGKNAAVSMQTVPSIFGIEPKRYTIIRRKRRLTSDNIIIADTNGKIQIIIVIGCLKGTNRKVVCVAAKSAT